MIRTEKEYRDALKRLDEDKEVVRLQKKKMKEMGLSSPQIETAMEPIISFHQQLKDEVKWYEQVKRGFFSPLENVGDIGLLLIGVRIYLGLSQKELAERLNVSEALVSRDERNEYHGITIERAQRILEALGAGIEVRVKERLKDAA